MLPEEEQRLRVLMREAQRLPLPPEEMFKRTSRKFMAPKRIKGEPESTGAKVLKASTLPRGAVERFKKGIHFRPPRVRKEEEPRERRPVGRPKKIRALEDDPSRYQIIPYQEK